ncbi:MAG: helix-turn-helix domain-containing protein [Eubacterium sp.]|nr:MAG TPA: helix-turn-helix domain protein [Bacteriophage sp.]
MNERIKKIRNSLNISQTDFAQKLSISRSAVCKMESGENCPSEQTIKLICNEFSVNEEWLRTGNGKMFKSRTREQEIGAFVNEVMELNDDSFEKKLVSALARLEPKDWECLEAIAKKLLDEK